MDSQFTLAKRQIIVFNRGLYLIGGGRFNRPSSFFMPEYGAEVGGHPGPEKAHRRR